MNSALVAGHVLVDEIHHGSEFSTMVIAIANPGNVATNARMCMLLALKSSMFCGRFVMP
jgi:hypothetical protein